MDQSQKIGVNVRETIANIKGMNKTNAAALVGTYGSIKDIVLADDYNEFLHIDGIGKGRIGSLLQAFRGDFIENVTKAKTKPQV